MLKTILHAYKRFEKCFFKADKTQDKVAYIKLKYQFRSMLCLSSVALLPAIYQLIANGTVLSRVPLLMPAVLIGFRTKSYDAVKCAFFLVLTAIPTIYPTTHLVLTTPIVIFLSTIQVMIQTQSDYMMLAHFVLQAGWFYYYGIERITAKLKEMNIEEIVEGAKTTIFFTFITGAITILSLKIFYFQFSRLLTKVNILKENLSKANSQLNDQNLKLQSNLEMKDVFIYTFSHELKNALNGLLGNLALAYDAAKNPQVIQFLSSAKVCGEVLKNFIHNILDSGKLENGNLEVAPERKDVMGFLQNVWTICGKIIQNKRLRGYLEIEKNVPKYLDLDEQRMIQIILNLVSNACKFTETGYVRIHVSWQTISTYSANLEDTVSPFLQTPRDKIEESARIGDVREFPNALEARPWMNESLHLITERQKKFIGGSRYELNLTKPHWNPDEVLHSTLPVGSQGILEIQVLDSGCGMTEEAQAKLFRKFSQVSSIQDQRKVGTGLGLWICKELANRLEGDIKTRSVVGVGSVFELKIRARVPEIPEKSRHGRYSYNHESLSSLLDCSPQNQRKPNSLKILIADDDSFNIELMKNYLTKFGISYIIAYDGEEAVSLFKDHYREIGFVITDNFMPKKTGAEAAYEIATFLEAKRQPKIPIMCISGDLKVAVDETGITSVIQKPINFERLREELMVVYPQLINK